jgi:hypothetical protein
MPGLVPGIHVFLFSWMVRRLAFQFLAPEEALGLGQPRPSHSATIAYASSRSPVDGHEMAEGASHTEVDLAERSHAFRSAAPREGARQ